MSEPSFGKILYGDEAVLRPAWDRWLRQPVDLDWSDNGLPGGFPRRKRTLVQPATVRGPGTFMGKSTRTVTFEPTDQPGWWFERLDLRDVLPFAVSARNVWTTGDIVSNIVLRAGPPHNYVRMVEHMVALKVGLGLDNVLVRIDSGDPPLFDHGSLELVEAVEKAGIRELEEPARFVTVRETVSACGHDGRFVVLAPPADAERPTLHVDCAIDFKTAIGQQRLRFTVTPERFREGAQARTNSTGAKMLYCLTVGKLFADIRNLGYTLDNLLVAGRRRYYNPPRLFHNGKSLEAVWHRAALDLLAALALIEEGQFVGRVISYRAGHTLDVELIRQLYKQRLLLEL